MKNATAYEKKVRKLLSGAGKKAPPAPQGLEMFRVMLEAILQCDCPKKAAASVMQTLDTEFVDYNELRVAPIKDITDCMPGDYYGAREKAESIVSSLNAIFDKTSSMSMDYMAKMPKRDLRKHLLEVGLTPYAASVVTLVNFSGHAIPVDQSLVESLELEGMVHPGSDIDDVQGFLERIVSQKDDYAVHELLRDLMDKHYKAVLKKVKEKAAAAPPPPPKPVVPEIATPVRPPIPPPGGPKHPIKLNPARAGKPAKPSKPSGRK